MAHQLGAGGGAHRQDEAEPRWLRAVRRRFVELVARLGHEFLAEREQRVLWLPAAVGIGIGIYFALPSEPWAWCGPLVMAAALLGAVIFRQRHGPALLTLLIFSAALGFGLAQWRSAQVAAPVVERRLGPVSVEGRVLQVEIRPEGRRVLLEKVTLPGRSPETTPARVRLRIRDGTTDLRPGDRVIVRAILQPPPAPAAPGAFNFQRQAWFERLGAVGYAVGPLTRSARDEPAELGWRARLNLWRQALVEEILRTVPGPAGAVIAALLTGEMGAIPKDVLEAMRDSGLAHLLSISGLHIGLVASAVFVAVRQALALVPALAVRYPIKKWAAVAAWIAITLYAQFTQPSVPTQRAWLMTSVVLFAVLIDRTAITLRLVAAAAVVVLVVAPETLLGASLQMSFAAVTALVAAWEAARRPMAAWRGDGGWVRRAGVWLGGAVFTTIIASAATAPYALYHFNRLALAGIIANLIAVPLTGLWVMPLAVLVFILLPFGAAAWAIEAMGWGVDAIIAIARWVAGWPGSTTLLPAMPTWGLALITLGGLWLCLWRKTWRLWGVPAIFLGLASISLTRPPDILVSGDGRLLAVRDGDGAMRLSSLALDRLTRETWLRRAGQSTAASFPKRDQSGDDELACDADACVLARGRHRVAFVRSLSALAEDCNRATVLIASVPVRRGCRGPSVVIDRLALWREGGHAIWLEPAGTAYVTTVRGESGDRPWVQRPMPRTAN